MLSAKKITLMWYNHIFQDYLRQSASLSFILVCGLKDIPLNKPKHMYPQGVYNLLLQLMSRPDRLSYREVTSDLNSGWDDGNWSPKVAIQKLQGAVKVLQEGGSTSG